MVTKQQLSVDEYLALPEEPPYSEYVYGEVVEKMSPVPHHSDVVEELVLAFRTHRQHAGGYSGVELRVRFRTERGDEFRLPDYAYWADGRDVGRPPYLNPPTLAIEVRSPGESMEQQRAKCRYYRQYGVEVAWLIDPESRTAEVFDAGRDGERLGSEAVLTSDALPGFELVLSELFATLD